MKKKFGKRLRELRTAKMLTQENVAELIDIKPENYSRIENGLSFPKPDVKGHMVWFLVTDGLIILGNLKTKAFSIFFASYIKFKI